MSLRAFHLLFIALSVILAAFFSAWATGQYRAEHQIGYALASVGSFVAGAGLAVYGMAFRRRTRNL